MFQVRTGGIHLDIPILLVAEANSGSLEERKNFLIQLGMTASSLEHSTPEQMFNTDPANPTQAISAVKALQLA
ncbi:MAG TPA: hypothetical protein ENK65_00640, partial [Helicobacteraceae bacterium]|nr:hypothetical protein [Helicobacteraceae bacterium]